MWWDFFIPKVGVDAAEVHRFQSALADSSHTFFHTTFTDTERTYCNSFVDCAPHYAGTFAAKEAASKALGTEKFPLLALEIRRATNGAPEVWKNGVRLPVNISITHTNTIAIAVAVTRFFR